MNSTKHVLSVPRFDRWIVPHAPPYVIKAGESMRIKQTLPIVGPLAIYVVLTELARNRSGKEDQAGVPAE
jgi:hypothetical protein